MIRVDDFENFVQLAMESRGYAHLRPVITKELLHYDILFTLEVNGFLDRLVFQGGTALRLCYGGHRLSEDLDFVGGSDFSTSDMLGIKDCLQDYLSKRYGLEVDVKEPKDLVNVPQYKDIKVRKWQISIVTSPQKRDLPKQRIKLEVANVPAYSRVPRALTQNYDFLPDGYSDIIIMTESLDEIMADKLVSLVSCQKYIRYRDIWDLRWLKQRNANVNSEYILAKLRDYKEMSYAKKLSTMQKQLDAIVHSQEFFNEMTRFIPMDTQERTLKKDKFLDFLINETHELLEQVKKIVDAK